MQRIPLEFSPAVKLDILRRLDCFHPWQSLDEKRHCRRCGETIDGWQIAVLGGTRGDGPLRLQCPTEGCCSVPIEWIVLESSANQELSQQVGAAEPEANTVNARPHPGRHLGRLFGFLKVSQAIL